MELAKTHRRRIRILVGFTIAMGILTIGRLFSLQIVSASLYKERAERQYATPLAGTFDRGDIYFLKRNGETVAAATVASGFKVAIVPKQITDPDGTASVLSQIIPLDVKTFTEKAQKKNDPYEEVAERISKEQADAIVSLGIPGISVYRQKWRLYPGEELASQTIGFLSYKGKELLGRYGLERQYNEVLARKENDLYVNFFAEIFANVQSTVFENESFPGDIVTTIEPSVQRQLQTTLGEIQSTWGSDAVGGVVLDPTNGEILALGYTPTFNLNTFNEVENISVFSNPVVESVYEMGSIIKPIVMAGALDAGAVTPSTSYVDTGSVVVQDRTFYNFDRKGRGRVTMQDVLNQSLNTGMVFTEQKMGKEKFKEYMLERYKIGEKTGIDLPGEVNGITGGLKTPNDVNYASSAFGQGIATTPINIVRAYASLANGGTLITPHVVKEIRQKNGSTRTPSYTTQTGVITPQTAQTITQMLVEVVDKSYKRGLAHYSVAAKTGTAQMARPDGKGYYDDRNFHSLIGYFPASQPRFVLYLFNNYPKGASFSSETLADPFFEMVQFLTSYYEVTPDR